jgi:hypothetical protein
VLKAGVKVREGDARAGNCLAYLHAACVRKGCTTTHAMKTHHFLSSEFEVISPSHSSLVIEYDSLWRAAPQARKFHLSVVLDDKRRVRVSKPPNLAGA